MSPTIYTSQVPSVPLPTSSIFTHLFETDPSTGYIGGYPCSSPAFIDASTSTTLTRSTLKSLSLSLGYGLTTSHSPSQLQKLTKGDTVMIFSPNSLAWPIVLFGAVSAGLRCTLANSAYTPTELKHQWMDSGAKVAFVHPSLVGVVREMFKTGLGWEEKEVRRRVVVSGTEWLTGQKDEGTFLFTLSSLSNYLISWIPLGSNPSDASLIQLPSLLNKGTLSQEVLFSSEKEANETVYLCYSSGTTGKPKGVEVSFGPRILWRRQMSANYSCLLRHNRNALCPSLSGEERYPFASICLSRFVLFQPCVLCIPSLCPPPSKTKLTIHPLSLFAS